MKMKQGLLFKGRPHFGRTSSLRETNRKSQNTPLCENGKKKKKKKKKMRDVSILPNADNKTYHLPLLNYPQLLQALLSSPVVHLSHLQTLSPYQACYSGPQLSISPPSLGNLLYQPRWKYQHLKNTRLS